MSYSKDLAAPVPKVLNAIKNTTESGIIVGNLIIDGFDTVGSGSLDTDIGSVTDIDDPAGTGGWTDVVDLTGAYFITPLRVTTGVAAGVNIFAGISVDIVESSGTALRLQILLDSVIIADVKATQDAAEATVTADVLIAGVTNLQPISCQESFLIRAAREGSTTNGATGLSHGTLYYFEV